MTLRGVRECGMPDLGLAEAIEAVRGELRRAQESRADGDVRFRVGSVEIEFVVDLEKTAWTAPAIPDGAITQPRGLEMIRILGAG